MSLLLLTIVSIIIWIRPPKKYRLAREIIRTQKRLGLKKSEYVYGDISSQYARAIRYVKDGDMLYIRFNLKTKLKCEIIEQTDFQGLIEPGAGQNLPFKITVEYIGSLQVPVPCKCLYTQMRNNGSIKKGDIIAVLNINEADIQAVYDERKRDAEVKEMQRKRVAEEMEKQRQIEEEEKEKQRQIEEAHRREELRLRVEKEREERIQREKNRIEREKKEIEERIKERHRKKELEKQVRQELIDKGELFDKQAKRPPIPRDVVDAIYRRDGGRCVYCGSTENLQLDHIIPFSRGGSSNIENLQLLCQRCNIEKSNKIG